jgi:hypothetical protein
MMIMIVEDGHKQAFNPNLGGVGGVVGILNPRNDFRGLH